MVKLLDPSTGNREAFLRLAQGWLDSGNDRYRLALDDFDAYLARVDRFRDAAQVPAGRVPATELWVDAGDGEIVACVRLRWWLTPSLEVEGGQIGYDVRPSSPDDWGRRAVGSQSAMPMDRQPVLVGDLLELRPLRPDDFEALFRVAADPLIWEQHPERERYREPTFRVFFNDAIDSGGALAAIDRASGEIIGSSRFHWYDPEQTAIEIGWSFLARAYWGGRYNGEMKRLMLDHAFRSVDRVVFVIGPENRRSRRAVEKIGGVLAGTTQDAQGRERVLYELTRSRRRSEQS